MVSFDHFQKYYKFGLECKPGKHETAFRARKVTSAGLSRNGTPRAKDIYNMVEYSRVKLSHFKLFFHYNVFLWIESL